VYFKGLHAVISQKITFQLQIIALFKADTHAAVFLFSTWFRPALEPTQPLIQWVLGALSSGVKRQGREADHSPADSADVKKMWIYTSTPPYAFMA
jgi:hypothetical protein